MLTVYLMKIGWGPSEKVAVAGAVRQTVVTSTDISTQQTDSSRRRLGSSPTTHNFQWRRLRGTLDYSACRGSTASSWLGEARLSVISCAEKVPEQRSPTRKNEISVENKVILNLCVCARKNIGPCKRAGWWVKQFTHHLPSPISQTCFISESFVVIPGADVCVDLGPWTLNPDCLNFTFTPLLQPIPSINLPCPVSVPVAP